MKDYRLLYCTTALYVVGLVCCTMLAMHTEININTVLMIGTMVTMGAGFMAQHFKTQIIDQKLDANTAVTVEAKKEAKTVAEAVAVTAKEAVATATATTKEAAASAATEAVSTVKAIVNGRMDELLTAVREAGHAEGKAEGLIAAREIQEQLSRHQKKNEEHVESLRQQLEAMKAEIARNGEP